MDEPDQFTADELRGILNPPNPIFPPMAIPGTVFARDLDADGWQEIGYIDKSANPFGCSLRRGAIVFDPDIFKDRSGYEGMTVEMIVADFDAAVQRAILGIPAGFPLWYRPEQLALPVGPIGRAQMKIREILDDPIVRALITGAVL